MLYKKAREILEQNIANQCDEKLSEALYTILDNAVSKKNYVSKSKIREKIRECQSYLKNADEYNTFGECDLILSEIEVLKELLNGKEE